MRSTYDIFRILNDDWYNSDSDIMPATQRTDSGMMYAFDVPGSAHTDVTANIIRDRIHVKVMNRGRALETSWKCPQGHDLEGTQVDCTNGVLKVFIPRATLPVAESKKLTVTCEKRPT